MNEIINLSYDLQSPISILEDELSFFCSQEGSQQSENVTRLSISFQISLHALEIGNQGNFTESFSTLKNAEDIIENLKEPLDIAIMRVWFASFIAIIALLMFVVIVLIGSARRAEKAGFWLVDEVEQTRFQFILDIILIPLLSVLMALAWFSTSATLAVNIVNAGKCKRVS